MESSDSLLDSHHFPSKKPKFTNKTENPSTSNKDPIPVPGLPQELITEILLRLPVKSLLKFKCASKSWHFLISSHQFIKSHFALSSSKKGQCLNHQLIFTFLAPDSSLKNCSLCSVLDEPLTLVSELDYPMKDPDKSVWVVGSVNGLICLAIDEKDLFLWNPILRKSKKLPGLDTVLKNGAYVIYGFGYDEANDDYKIVRILCVYHHGGGYETEVKVYSVRTNSWRRIEDFKGGPPLVDTGKYANGKLHWTASEPSGTYQNWKIVSLDMENENYEETKRPDYGSNVCVWTFGVLKGCLSVLCEVERTKADLWVMDKRGVNESWSKMLSIPYDVRPGKGPDFLPMVLCSLDNGEIVLGFGSYLAVYDSKRGKFRFPQLSDGKAFFEVDMYAESLVSPNALGASEI